MEKLEKDKVGMKCQNDYTVFCNLNFTTYIKKKMFGRKEYYNTWQFLIDAYVCSTNFFLSINKVLSIIVDQGRTDQYT